MNNNIYKYYEKQINECEKLSFEEAKKLLKDSLNKDDETKKQVIDRVFKGTIHYVLNFIKSNNFNILESCLYDLNDIFSVCYSLWYEKIKDYSILNANNSSKILDSSFIENVANSIIGSNTLKSCYHYYESNNYYVKFNKKYFEDFMYSYFLLRNNNMNINKRELIDYVFNNYGDNEAEYLCYAFDEIDLLNIFEKCYLLLSDNNQKEVDLNKDDIKKFRKFIEEMGLFEKLNNSYCSNENVEEKVMEKSICEEIDNIIFEKDILTDNEKEVLAYKYGFYGNEEYLQKQIADMMNVSRSRIGQIEQKAFSKLKHSRRSKNLRKYL